VSAGGAVGQARDLSPAEERGPAVASDGAGNVVGVWTRRDAAGGLVVGARLPAPPAVAPPAAPPSPFQPVAVPKPPGSPAVTLRGLGGPTSGQPGGRRRRSKGVVARLKPTGSVSPSPDGLPASCGSGSR
jgi:hypothetical protein